MDLAKMTACYTEYRSRLAAYRERVKQNRLWFMGQQTEFQGHEKKERGAPSSHSGHIFNAIQYKHADMMDNYPEANILPREEKDEEIAKVLTEIVPFILERCSFRSVYDLNLYNKLISGTCAYGVFFDERANDGKGDIVVKSIELLNLTWQPDASSLSESRYIFYDTFVDSDDFVMEYGSLENVTMQSAYDEQKENTGEDVHKTVVVTDAYYKKLNKNGKKVLHYARFSGNRLLFSSEDDKAYEDGFYKHGEFPFVFDVINPVPGTLTGLGIVDIAKDMQAYIDRLDSAINRKSLLCSRDRYLFSENSGVSENEFLDLDCTLVHVAGSLDETRAKPIFVNDLPSYVIEHRNNKIAELKEIVGNRDFAQGGSSGGVVAASAITALQSASDKLVRDSVSFSYLAFSSIVSLIIELIREFYDEPRIFRITGDDGKNEYRQISSSELFTGNEKCVFDIKMTVEKNNPYQRATHNQLILELSNMGLLNPENFENSSFILRNLNFDGKEKLIRDLEELYNKAKTPPPDAAGGAVLPGAEIGSLANGTAAADELVEIPIGENGDSSLGELVEIPI